MIKSNPKTNRKVKTKKKTNKNKDKSKPKLKKLAPKGTGKKKKRSRSRNQYPLPPLPKTTAGRRTLLTPQVLQDLVQVISVGNYYVTACNYAGVAESTFYSWLKRGEEELQRLMDAEKESGKAEKPEKNELLYLEFLEAIKRAEAGSEVSAVVTVKSAFNNNWQAAMTFLERRFSGNWRRKDRFELVGDKDNPIPVHVYLPDNNRDNKDKEEK